MLTLTFLGVGSAFAKRNFNSNLLIEAWQHGPDSQDKPDDSLIVDFGSTGPQALYELMQRPGFAYLNNNGTINYPAIHRVFITHQHADHIGGLEEMALMNRYFYRDLDKTKPYKAQIISAASILSDLWDNSLKGGLVAMAGRYALLQDYFFILALNHQEPGQDGFTLFRRYRLTLFPTDHIQIERKFDWPSFGLFIEDTATGQAAFFSGDTRFGFEDYGHMMERSRICFHEVQLTDEENPVHSLLNEVRTLPEAIRRKTWLYHYGDNWDCGEFDFVPDEFAGFAIPQRRFTLFE
ncbi:MAG TPA: MBL fold metallo-hydrolase [Phycisphaerae bacterium]|nr:MBL fold metallo-hydrolase [Phycisphaerae bacterium]